MTPEAQRIAIAEICGLEYGKNDSTGEPGWWKGDLLVDLPNYPFDLNAMHEAEDWLKKDQLKWRRYALELLHVVFPSFVSPPSTWHEMADVSHANASQRAEAFLRTLGLWKE